MARDGDLVVDPFPALLSLEKTGELQVAVSVWDLAEASPEVQKSLDTTTGLTDRPSKGDAVMKARSTAQPDGRPSATAQGEGGAAPGLSIHRKTSEFAWISVAGHGRR